MNRGVRILLIDDDGSITTLLRRILTRESHKVELVQDLHGLPDLGLIRPLQAAKPTQPIDL